MREEVPHLQAPAVRICARALLVHHPADRGAGRTRATLPRSCNWIGSDRLMFSTDYPHWDFDDPQLRLQGPADRGAARRTSSATTRRRCTAVSRERVASTSSRRRARSRPGPAKIVTVAGREIGIFNVGGEFFALANRCPHAGGPLCAGRIVSAGAVRRAGQYRLARASEFLRCPWHGWEFDIRTGQSWCDPELREGAAVRRHGRAGRKPR